MGVCSHCCLLKVEAKVFEMGIAQLPLPTQAVGGKSFLVSVTAFDSAWEISKSLSCNRWPADLAASR